MNITDLPAENLLHIFSHLKENDLASAASTCSAFKNLSTDKSFKFPRISSKVSQNISEGRFFLSHRPLETLPNVQHVFHVIDSDPVLLKIEARTDLDPRTTIKITRYANNTAFLTKVIRIDEKLVFLKNTTLTLDDTIIENNVIDFACLNGSILYSDLKGLHRYHLSTDKSERITKKVYSRIAVDERNGIIYGIDSANLRTDKLDFNHPDAKIRKEDTLLYALKTRISQVAVTFFREFKNFVVENASWKVGAFILGSLVVISLAVGIFIGTTLAEIMLLAGLSAIIFLTTFIFMAFFETLKHAVLKASSVAFKPL